MEKIVITGIGIISPLGIGKEEFWKNDQAGLSVTCSSEYMKRLHIKSTVNASIDCDIDTYLNNSQLQYLKNESRFCKLEVIATNEAIKDSKIMSRVSRKRIGIISSSAIGGTPEIQKTYEKLTDNKGKLEYKEVGKEFYNDGMFNFPAEYIAKYYNLSNVCVSLSTGCTAGIDALFTAIQMIKSGEADAMIVCASEAPLCSLTYGTLDSIGALSQWKGAGNKASRPFDKRRKGFVLSEAGASIIIERESDTLGEKVPTYGSVKGFASYNNSSHMTDLKDPTVLIKTIESAIKRSKLNLNEIDYINAHGSSTIQNDKCESLAINKVFKKYVSQIPVSSTKSMMGHPLSAASLVALIATLGAINNNIVPPNINYEYPDKECSINVNNYSINKKIKNALIMASGFGGIHSACVIGK